MYCPPQFTQSMVSESWLCSVDNTVFVPLQTGQWPYCIFLSCWPSLCLEQWISSVTNTALYWDRRREECHMVFQPIDLSSSFLQFSFLESRPNASHCHWDKGFPSLEFFHAVYHRFQLNIHEWNIGAHLSCIYDLVCIYRVYMTSLLLLGVSMSV
jgi:hypothetical protein